MSVADDNCQVRRVEAGPAWTEMISAVAGTVAAFSLVRPRASFPADWATGAGGVQPSTAADSSFSAADEAPEELDDDGDPEEVFGVGVSSPEHPATDKATTPAKAMDPSPAREPAARGRFTWHLPQGRRRH